MLCKPPLNLATFSLSYRMYKTQLSARVFLHIYVLYYLMYYLIYNVI